MDFWPSVELLKTVSKVRLHKHYKLFRLKFSINYHSGLRSNSERIMIELSFMQCKNVVE